MPNSKTPQHADSNAQPKRDGRSVPQTCVAIHPKENTEEEKIWLGFVLLNIAYPGKYPIPPRPEVYYEGRELVEIREEICPDCGEKIISVKEAVYRENERKGRTPLRRREG
jgi:hypothetical protein